MSVIALEGMRFYAYHGFYEEENVLGGEYVVNVRIKADTKKAAADDDLQKTVNYETVYAICDFEMRKSSRLIETVLERIHQKIRDAFDNLISVHVRIEKLNPPLGGRVAKAVVESKVNLQGKCGRCGKGIANYGDIKSEKRLHPRTAEMLSEKYGSPLCRSCLDFYAG